MSWLNIGEKVSVEFCGKTEILTAIENEFDELISYNTHHSILGCICCSDEKICLPNNAILLLDKRLYYDKESCYILSGNNCIKCNINRDCFQITIDNQSDTGVVIDLLQTLLNYYMPKYGITFLHTAAFRFNNQVCAIHAFGGAGKTETMLQALYDGANFISDDLAVFNENGEICPYPRKISLHGYRFNDEELNLYGLSKKHYRRLDWLKSHPNRITNYLYQRWRWEFHIKFNHETVTGKKTPIEFYPVNYHYWLDSNGKTSLDVMDKNLFAKKMKFCMQNEFCSYINYNGYFQTIYPFWKDIVAEYDEMLTKLISNIKIQRATINKHDYHGLKNQIIKIIR